MSPDRQARLIVIHSFLYYGLSHNIIADHEFDAMCQQAADEWDELSPLRQWQLGSPSAIRATGFHCKITMAGIGACEDLLKGRISLPMAHSDIPIDEEHRVRWLPVSTTCQLISLGVKPHGKAAKAKSRS